MADPIGWVVDIIGLSQQSKAQKSQDEAYEAQQQAQIAAWESEVRTHEFNIGQTQKDIGSIQREGKAFKRGQSATMGASGATLGVGTPLMNMIETQAGIDTAIRTERDKITFLQEEITALKENLAGIQPEEEIPASALPGHGPSPRRRYPKQRE